MVANWKTIERILEIVLQECGSERAFHVLNRLSRETVPSGNSSYDETIRRLISYKVQHDVKDCDDQCPEHGNIWRALCTH